MRVFFVLFLFLTVLFGLHLILDSDFIENKTFQAFSEIYYLSKLGDTRTKISLLFSNIFSRL